MNEYPSAEGGRDSTDNVQWFAKKLGLNLNFRIVIVYRKFESYWTGAFGE